MSTCEDFPACGHELGCCPDFDAATGRQLNMRCTCGAEVPLTSRVSICAGCLSAPDPENGDYGDDRDDFYEEEPDEDDLDESEVEPEDY